MSVPGPLFPEPGTITELNDEDVPDWEEECLLCCNKFQTQAQQQGYEIEEAGQHGGDLVHTMPCCGKCIGAVGYKKHWQQ